MIMTIINAVFTVLFWNMCTNAAEEGRPGWAFMYLVCSAINGAAVATSIF